MEVILIKDVDNLGDANELVKVYVMVMAAIT